MSFQLVVSLVHLRQHHYTYSGGAKGGLEGGATAPLSGSASSAVGENLYICRGKLTKTWPTVPNHEEKDTPPRRGT